MSLSRVLIVDNPDDLKFSRPFDKSITCDQFDGKLTPDTHYFVIGEDSWNKIRENNHMGLRGNDSLGYIKYLKFLNMGNGISLTCIHTQEWLINSEKKWIEKPERGLTKDRKIEMVKEKWFNQIKEKMAPFFTDPTYGKSRVPELEEIHYITSDDQVESAFQRLESWTESDFGLDYETSGLTHEQHFQVIGVGISTNKFAYYFDWRLLDMDTYIPRYKKFLDNFDSRCWVRNVDFEQEATYRYMKKFYNFREMAALRVIEGISSTNVGSLKYITRDELGVSAWDIEYDDLLDNTTGDHWFEHVEKHYPNHIDEFWKFEKMGYNTSFTRIPTDIIGRYCCYDSYYTLMCYENKKSLYSPLCWDVYTNNYLAKNRLTGIFIDEGELDIQMRNSRTLYLMGTYYTIREYLKYQASLVGELPDYVKEDYFLSNCIFHYHKPSWLGKVMLSLVYDESKPYHIDLDLWDKYYGDEDLLNTIYSMIPQDWNPDTIGRKRKLVSHLVDWLRQRQEKYDLDSLENAISIHSKLNTLLNNNFDGMTFDEIYNSDTVIYNGEELTILDAQARLLDVYRLTAPDEFTELETTMNNYLTDNYKTMWTLFCVSQDHPRMEELTGIKSHKEQYERLLGDKDLERELVDTPANQYILHLDSAPHWFWNVLPSEVRSYMDNDSEFYSLIDNLNVPEDSIVRYYKYEVLKNCFKKYGKIISTYITSIMVKPNRWMHKEDGNLHSLRYFEGEDRSDIVWRSYPAFQNNSAATKRWSSGY